MNKERTLSAERRYEVECRSTGSRPEPVMTWWKGSRQMKKLAKNVSIWVGLGLETATGNRPPFCLSPSPGRSTRDPGTLARSRTPPTRFYASPHLAPSATLLSRCSGRPGASGSGPRVPVSRPRGLAARHSMAMAFKRSPPRPADLAAGPVEAAA